MALIASILQKRHSSYQKHHLTKMVPDINGTSQKWHLTKMASHKNGTSKLTLLVFWSTANTRLIKPAPAIRQKLEKLDFKTPWPLVWIVLQIKEFSLKNHSAQPLENELWAFFGKVCHFCKASFFLGLMFVYFRWIMSCAIFVRCHYFQMALRDDFFLDAIFLVYLMAQFLFFL